MNTVTQQFDTIVLGLGAMGSATMYELSQAKVRCLGIDQYTPVHDKGSSYGLTRAIRKAYFEHPDYVPLLLEAYKSWEKFEKEANIHLFQKSGLFHATDLDHEIYQGCVKSAKKHYIEFEELNQIDLEVKFPSIAFHDNKNALYEPDGGYILVEKAIQAYQDLINTKHGTLHFEEKMLEIQHDENKIIVITDKNIYACDHLVIATGAWSKKFCPHLPIQVKRMPYHIFEHPNANDMPVFFFNTPKNNWLYGFPPIDGKIKVAYHNLDGACEIDNINRDISQDEIDQIYEEAKQYLPSLGKHIESKVCMYTMTPDEHFIVGPCPKDKNVFIATGFSGHGFKFAPVIAKIMLDLVKDGETSYPIDFLKPKRFQK